MACGAMIRTRYKMPSPRKNFLRREALFGKLDGVLDHRVTVVRGAAGSGKTTLLTTYLKERSGTPYRWLTVDEGLLGSLAFWRCFSQAVATDGAGESVASLFDAAMGREFLEGLIPALVEELAGAGALVIVLDDFHLLRDADLLRDFEGFIRACPESAHFVLLTRQEPGIYLSDLAVSGELMDIEDGELRFTDEEALNFLTGTLGLTLPEASLQEIVREAEGWAGGLQLMALAPVGAAKRVQPMGRYAAEYLQREILGALPGELQAFLVKTAALDSFDEDICAALFPDMDIGKTIRALIDKNLFVVSVGGDAFRYHHIFRDFLLLQFAALDALERGAFYEAAAGYCEAHGRFEEAARILIRARAFRDAMAMIKRQGGDYRLWALLGEIPLDELRTDRDLVILRLFHLYYNGGPEELGAFLGAFKEEMARPEWKLLRIAKAVFVDFDFHADAMTEQEIDEIEVGPVAKAILCVKAGAFLYMKYELRMALTLLDKAEAALSGAGNPFIEISVWSLKSSVKEELGDFSECEALYEKIFRLIRESGLMAQLAYNFQIGMTGIYVKTGRLPDAAAALAKAKECARGINLDADAGYLYNLMELKLMEGDADGASDLIGKLLDLSYYQEMLGASTLVKYLAATGRLTAEMAERYEDAYRACEPRFLRVEDRIAFSRVLHFLGRNEEAAELVDGVFETLRKQKIRVKLTEALLFRHGMFDRSDDGRRAQDLLREAVYYAAPSRILSPFFMEGARLAAPLTQLVAQRGRDMTQAEKRFAAEVAARVKPPEAEAILSDRELEVLRKLATGASNKEIGEALFISLSTVKTHVINIYGKLQAGNRVEAAEKARSMGLIV